MINIISNILNLYIAMLLHYVLKWPYALKVFICIASIILAAYIAIKLIFFILKKWGLPLFFILLKYIIYLLQLLALTIVKLRPGQREKIEKIDESLNRFGIKLDEWQKQAKVEIPTKCKKILFVGLFLLLSASVLFIIVPYYMEPTLSGNAKEICATINQITDEIQNSIESYANRYYIPVVKTETPPEAEEDTNTALPEEAEKYILHLSAAGYSGANLRSSPEKITGNVIIAISGDVELIYENETIYDGEITWLKVSMKDIPDAWISKKLILEEDLNAAGIE